MKNFFLYTAFAILLSFSTHAQGWYETALPDAQIMNMCIYKSQLWAASYGKGIFCYDFASKTWKEYSTKLATAEDDFYYCIAVSDNYIWAGTSEGLYIYDRKTALWKKRKFSAGGEYGNWIRALHYDSETNMLWIGRFQFLTKLDVAKQKYEDINLTMGKDDRSNNIRVIHADGTKLIWIGTESGVFRYDKSKSFSDINSYEYFTNSENTFKADGDFISISEIFTDKYSVWFGTDEFVTQEKPNFNLGGLFRFNRKAEWQKYNRLSGLLGNGIKSIAKGAARLWVGTYSFDRETKTEIGQGLSVLNLSTGKVQNIRMEEINGKSNLIYSLLFEGDELWIGTEKGLYKIILSNPFASFAKNKIKK